MRITISYRVNVDTFGFEIERFAAKARNEDGRDNNDIKAPDSSFLNDMNKPQFLETTLPFASSNGMDIPLEIGLDQKAKFALYSGELKL